MQKSNSMKQLCRLGLKYRNTILVPEQWWTTNFSMESGSDSIRFLRIGCEFQLRLHQLGYHMPVTDLKKYTEITNLDTLVENMNLILDLLGQATGATIPHYLFFGKKLDPSIDAERERDILNSVSYILTAFYGKPVDGNLCIVDTIDPESFNPNQVVQRVDSTPLSFEQLKETVQDVESLKDLFANDPDQFIILPLSTEIEWFCAEIYTNLVSSNVPLNDTQRDDLLDLLDLFTRLPLSHPAIQEALETPIVCKETLAYLISECFTHTYPFLKYFTKSINNATDILRILDLYSGGTGMIRKYMKFKRLKGEERRMFLELLRTCPHRLEGFSQYPELWKCALNTIKPERYKHPRYQEVRADVDRLRDGDLPQTVNAIVQSYITKVKDQTNYIGTGLNVLSQFPGHFIRAFDKYVRTASKKLLEFYNTPDTPDVLQVYEYEIAKTLTSVVKQVQSTTMLIQLLSYYSRRLQHPDQPRVFKIKGKRYFQMLPPVGEPLISESHDPQFIKQICQVIYLEIASRFHTLPYLGKIYVDPSICGYTVPLDLREMNVSDLKIIGRGSGFSYSDADFLFPYVHWTNGKDRTRYDIDLSMVFLSEQLTKLNIPSCSYMEETVRGSYDPTEAPIAVHSGDFTNGGSYEGVGVTECISLNLSMAKAHGVRYCAVMLHDYTKESFSNDHTFFGIQYMKHDPETDLQSILMTQNPILFQLDKGTEVLQANITSRGISSLTTVLIDLVEQMIYWVDLDLGSLDIAPINNVNKTYGQSVNQLQAFLNRPYLFCEDLIRLHTNVRGIVVDDPSIADVIFADETSVVAQTYANSNTHRIITPNMVDVWLGELLTPLQTK